MILCPVCGASNMEGLDHCEQCENSLSDLHLPPPGSELERSLYTDRIRLLWPRKPVAVAPQTPVAEVLKILVTNTIGCVMIVEEHRIIGIFTERDALLKLNVQACEFGERPISDFMTANPQMLGVNDKIAFAVQRMDLGGYRHVPIVDEQQQLVGVISVRDILQYLMQKIATLSPPA
ncbi:MAG TPA: CBS domain-containing protein [Pirellulaceae bacterium]|nr:CBS domain-containing protein [Pirellulaceae bacterium]